MKYYYKVFLWEKGNKTREFTQFLTAPIFYEDRLNEELDTGEIVLDNMDIETKHLFPPKTKIRLERYMTPVYTDSPKKWDMIVEHDDVETYTGRSNKCCHRIHLIEPSAVAQGLHIDNIALTYELQDVTLLYKTYKEDSTLLGELVNIVPGGTHSPIKQPEDPTQKFDYGSGFMAHSNYNYFQNSYFYIWKNTESIKSLKLNLSSNAKHTITFEIPTLMCQGCPNGGSFEDIFEVNTITRVWRTETRFNNPDGFEKELIIEKVSGPSQITASNNSTFYTKDNKYYLRKIKAWKDADYSYSMVGDSKDSFSNHYETSGDAISYASVDFENKEIEFDTIALNDVEIESGKGYLYEIECVAYPLTQNSMMDFYSFKCLAEAKYFDDNFSGIGSSHWAYKETGSLDQVSVLQPSSILVDATFNITDLSSDAVGGPMLMKGVKYSCYELLRKALLTIDTQIIDNDVKGIDEIEYFLKLDPLWENRLKTAKVQETILENKNLWEVLLQIGYYLHAIPYLTFAEDGTDRFVLSFNQLGDFKKKEDTSSKTTIFNSKNLNDYFAQYDSYVTNLFSPQNMVDEWLVVKTNDSSSLVSNNTSILRTTYGISEILEFEITYDGSAGGNQGTASALNHIFEKSIYQILTSEYNVSPGKGDSLYYSLGDTLIEGLNYCPPSKNNDTPMALKRIVGKLFSGVDIKVLKFNNLKFHIKYRTQDNMRISQVRPNLQDFMKNSSYEKYPHHEQFYGQQDKIIDSERFSRNLFGKLVRVGNDIYQCQEKVVNEIDLKESGDLVEIDGEGYYVTIVENEWYPDAIFQKVTYSKNYNQISCVVTIPSEPRFYEVSERSKIRREVRLFDFLNISTEKPTTKLGPRFLNSQTWQTFIKALLFNKEKVEIPNYAWLRFKTDNKRHHRGAYGQNIPNDQMFPSVEIDRSNPNQIMPKSSSDHVDCIVPLLHFPLHDGIIFECDMEDNFKAGDSTDTTISGKNDIVDDAYYAVQSVRYCDILGRADFFTLRFFSKLDWTHEQAQILPKACIEPEEEECQMYLPSQFSIGLDKDCREELSFNYQICLLHKDINKEGDFVTFSNIFGSKDSELYCCLLDREVSMFDENTTVISATVLLDNVEYDLIENSENGILEVSFETPEDVELSSIKSVVFYEIDSSGNKVSYLAKNFKNGLVDSIPSFFIYPVFNDN